MRLEGRLRAVEKAALNRKGGVPLVVVAYDPQAEPPPEEWVKAKVAQVLKACPWARVVRLRWPPTGGPEDWSAGR